MPRLAEDDDIRFGVLTLIFSRRIATQLRLRLFLMYPLLLPITYVRLGEHTIPTLQKMPWLLLCPYRGFVPICTPRWSNPGYTKKQTFASLSNASQYSDTILCFLRLIYLVFSQNTSMWLCWTWPRLQSPHALVLPSWISSIPSSTLYSDSCPLWQLIRLNGSFMSKCSHGL